MTHILARIVEWQLLHPTATLDDCRAWLLSDKSIREIERLVYEARLNTGGPGKGAQKERGKGKESKKPRQV